MNRESICFPRWGTQDVTKKGDADFEKEQLRWYSPEEAETLERLVHLKGRLRDLSTNDFWTELVEGIAHIMRAEIAFVMKRVLVDDQNSAVEMPPIGEPGSCLMAAALHYCASDGQKHTVKGNKFHAYACPCAYMRHDKVFVIPENLDDFITNNPNTMPVPIDAYMAVPLFAEGKCIAHFGVMWSKESSPNERLSWAFIETLLHALEDMIGQRMLEGFNFVEATKAPLPPQQPTPPQTALPFGEQQQQQQQLRVIPHQAISIAQSLRPYAGSLSHELRTPMQGVVGMLDVMYATVQEAVESAENEHLKKVFQNLIESIEVVQDSSRRAVVAADNVVHAYDMNMSIPESAHTHDEAPDDGSISPRTLAPSHDKQPHIVVSGHDLPLPRVSNKRRRSSDLHGATNNVTSPGKIAKLEGRAGVTATSSHADGQPEASQEIKDGLHEAEHVFVDDRDLNHAARHRARLQRHTPEPRPNRSQSPTFRHVHRHVNIRTVLQYVINEGLKTGGRPDFVSAVPTAGGEIIEVKTRGSNNTFRQKIIKWTVDNNVPKMVNFDEKDFSKLASCLVLNAIKFTDGMDGRVDVRARQSASGRNITISIADNGPGMPAEFLPRLFKPFSQNNGSITRQSDGLGLGLMVAKGIARKLGGDLTCVKSETQPPNNGCEFEIKLPLIPGDPISRPSSPLSSPHIPRRHDDNIEPLKSPPRSQLNPKATTPANGVTGSGAARPRPVRTLSAINNLADAIHATTNTKPAGGKTKAQLNLEIDRALAKKYPLTLLVAEDNKINRKLLVSMLNKLGYTDVFEAHDGAEAVRQMALQAASNGKVDVVLMDLWMPLMDGYEATERILRMDWQGMRTCPTVLAVTADVTDDALDRAAAAGMKGFMTKPYKLLDLQRLITEYCTNRHEETIDTMSMDGHQYY